VEPTKAAVKPTIAAAKPNNGVVTIAKAGRCNCLSSSLLLADESTSKAPIATNKAGPSGKAEGKVRSPEYSSKDLLILAQSYIRVSENAIDGTAKKSSTFWEEVAVTFNKLKQSQGDIHLIFLKENIGIKSFDPYRPAWEYLKESPKFISMTAATNAAPRVVSSTVTNDDNVESHVVSAEDMPTASKFSVRPIGNKKAKRMAEEEKIMSNVTEKLKSTLIPATTSTATSAALAGALHKVTQVIATGIKEWSSRQAYSNASPTLKRHYDSLLLKLRIRELESKLQKEEFGEEVQRKGGILRNEEVGEEMQHEVGILPNDEHSETCVAVEATTIAGVPAPITEVEFVKDAAPCNDSQLSMDAILFLRNGRYYDALDESQKYEDDEC